MSEDPSIQRYKRKRKKSFLKNARKYGKKGCFGRGTSLDSDTYQYFVRILEVYNEGFPTNEEKCLFVNNVFEQTKSKEIDISCNQIGCRVIEMLLPFTNNVTLEQYMEAFSSNLRPLCNDRFASHVIQAILRETSRHGENDEDENFRNKCKEFSLKISKFLLNNLEDYIWDTYGNHIIRTVFDCLTMNDIAKSDKSDSVKTENVNEIPEEYKAVVKDYAERLIMWPQFKEMPMSEVTSGLLQVLLVCLSKIDKKLTSRYIKKLLNESFSAEASKYGCEGNNVEEKALHSLLPIFRSKSAVMLLETTIQVAKSKMYTKIYDTCFVNRLVDLSLHRNTNFAVQKLLTNSSNKIEFEAMYDELAGHFKEVIEAGHSGVILSLAQTCKRLSAKQGNFVQNYMSAFNCFAPEERHQSFIVCAAKLVTYENLNSSTINLNDKLNLHGTLIIQLMLEFNKPIKIVNSILSMEPSDLKNMFCNSMGSHIVDSYVNSPFVGEKSREKLVRKMKGAYQELASSKYGSRSFEAIWNICSVKYRINIMDELVYKDGSWSNSEFGKIIANRVNIVLYKRNKEDWKNSFDKTSRTQKLFQDVLN